jgi:hypothetical protein
MGNPETLETTAAQEKYTWITHSRLPCRLSLDYPFLVALSVVSNVYLSCVPSVASVSGLPILGCPVGCLWITHSWLPFRLSLTFI